MHRVELKDSLSHQVHIRSLVPNAPCGVESRTGSKENNTRTSFLMHRVELKVVGSLVQTPMQSLCVPNAPCGVERKYSRQALRTLRICVPNAPCGVESGVNMLSHKFYNLQFLMHRVELKDKRVGTNGLIEGQFLMHRVELKVDKRAQAFSNFSFHTCS